jgi:hypothetical protein
MNQTKDNRIYFWDHRDYSVLKSIHSDLVSFTSPQDAPFVSIIAPCGEVSDNRSLRMDFSWS